mmetsp:Transcript_149527/g.261287  ORF Transcript_149527/g.261287 Transcript_149527/m.261287 type:complete len:231 (-) Transcript_149527:497-1189(-)
MFDVRNALAHQPGLQLMDFGGLTGVQAVNGVDRLAAVEVGDHCLDAGLAPGSSGCVQLPGFLEHHLEVLVVRDHGTHVFVVLAKLIKGDDPISRGIPCSCKLSCDLLSSHAPCKHLRMLVRVEFQHQFVNGHRAIAIDVQQVEGCLAQVLPAQRHVRHEKTEELVDVDLARVVTVEVVKKDLQLVSCQVHPEGCHPRLHLHPVQFVVAAVIHDSEHPSKCRETPCACTLH